MSSLFRALNIQGHGGQPTPLPTQANASTFYFRKSPLWARWALVLVSVDMILVGATVAYTRHDYRPTQTLARSDSDSKRVPVDAKVATSTNSNAEAAHDAPLTGTSIPFWKRAAWSGFHVIGGCVAASLILATRARIVRTMTYLPPARKGSKGPKSPPRIHLETAAHPYGFGLEVPLQDCLLAVGKEGDASLKFKIKDQGYWVASLMGAKINGHPVSSKPKEAREDILKAWRRIGEMGTAPTSSNVDS